MSQMNVNDSVFIKKLTSTYSTVEVTSIND